MGLLDDINIRIKIVILDTVLSSNKLHYMLYVKLSMNLGTKT